jgi:hypothetical protein
LRSYMISHTSKVFLSLKRVSIHSCTWSLFTLGFKISTHTTFTKAKKLTILAKGGIFRWKKSYLVFSLATFHDFTLKAFAPINISNFHLMEELVYVLSSTWMGCMVLVCFRFQERHNFCSILNLLALGLNLLFRNFFFQ